MKIALAADHAGYEQAKVLKIWLGERGHECLDYGPKALLPGDDYPDYIIPAAKAVASMEADRAIVLGGSGQGEAMAANRLPGVRAAVYYGPAIAKMVVDAGGRVSHDPFEIVKLSRQHNNSNVLSIGARFVGLEEMKQVISLWLDTTFSSDQRHIRRVDRLDQEA